MKLQESYNLIKEGIVAFIPKYTPRFQNGTPPPEFPSIIGTGFVVKEDGLILTNNHVIKEILKLPRPPGVTDWPFTVIFLKLTDEGLLQIHLEVIGVFAITQFKPQDILAYYGPKIPDIAFVHVKITGLPALEIDDSIILEEGLEIATAGYPMGTDALMAPGWLHQITPTLQRGIISAILPFTCPKPHAFAINIMTQGGASGSPVFSPETGKVVGVLYGGLQDVAQTNQNASYTVPTNISYVVPSYYIVNMLKNIEGDPKYNLHEDTMSVDELIKSGQFTTSHAKGEIYAIRKAKPQTMLQRSHKQLNPETDKKEFD